MLRQGKINVGLGTAQQTWNVFRWNMPPILTSSHEQQQYGWNSLIQRRTLEVDNRHLCHQSNCNHKYEFDHVLFHCSYIKNKFSIFCFGGTAHELFFE